MISLRVPCYTYTAKEPQTPVLIMKAPTLFAVRPEPGTLDPCLVLEVAMILSLGFRV